jgi:hypothetical protein
LYISIGALCQLKALLRGSVFGFRDSFIKVIGHINGHLYVRFVLEINKNNKFSKCLFLWDGLKLYFIVELHDLVPKFSYHLLIEMIIT